jgi:hypothetical protein
VRFAPNVLLVLSLPAGFVGFVLGSRLVAAMSLPSGVNGIAELFIPLFIAGLVMLPFLIPFFDRMAKRDLEAHRRDVAAGLATTDVTIEATSDDDPSTGR